MTNRPSKNEWKTMPYRIPSKETPTDGDLADIWHDPPRRWPSGWFILLGALIGGALWAVIAALIWGAVW